MFEIKHFKYIELKYIYNLKQYYIGYDINVYDKTKKLIKF